MKLSILITSIDERQSLLSRLLFKLEPQLNSQVEVLISQDNRIKPIGDKVNDLINNAKGEYVVLVDDDDYLADNYVYEVLNSLKDKPDFVGYKLLALSAGNYWFEISHDGNHRGEWDGINASNRGVSPKCPIRKDIFKEVGFGNSYTSDRDWINKVESSGKVIKSNYIDKCLYIYDFWDDTSIWSGKGFRDVGSYPFNRDKFIWL